ncbi:MULTISPECIES: hypothetical protein [Nostoc]|uniref:Secreted protein n=1 Tax=Nostoc punctiforme FACHB-252 TaxID=1357509 RepID=A0ABR8HIM7_NOSPU|nr:MULTISPECIES: hypothetical protein [Nostoc]MBD2615232.1 hypothetical protein [Nostoc punctiforme FACHB-252]MBL1200291.1 hypothetical protein [Nostoc sp. GBBB01]MDZ8011991.1 hypothetical protein [Nostoc sp. ZfuVER08]
MLPIVDWAFSWCASFALRICGESILTPIFADHDRYCSTCLQLIFHEVDGNFSHFHVYQLYKYCMTLVYS